MHFLLPPCQANIVQKEYLFFRLNNRSSSNFCENLYKKLKSNLHNNLLFALSDDQGDDNDDENNRRQEKKSEENFVCVERLA